MSTTFIAMFVAILMGTGLLAGLAVLSLLSGSINFLFVKPKFTLLKSQHGPDGLAFSYTWDQSAEDVTFDKIRIQLFNPFGNPKQLEVTREFDRSDENFARDLNLGDALKNLLGASGINDATIEITLFATRQSVSHTHSFKGITFLTNQKKAIETAELFNKKHAHVKTKPLFEIPERSFISPPLPKTGKALKLATNPEFAGQFAGGGSEAAAGPAKENFTVTKVWIEPGCIVCNACEGIFPEVFEVTATTCLIRPGAPLNDGLKIQESAEACPVEVIKFTR